MYNESNPLRAPVKMPVKVLNIAHRGVRAFAPENTVQAFEKAKFFGCHMFELDVHLSKDGRLVLHHDDTLIRCTDAALRFPNLESYFISDFTYERLRQLDAGSWYVRELDLPPSARQPFLQTLTDLEIEKYVSPAERALYESGQVKIPTLEEALEVALQLKMLVNIHLKSLPRMYQGLTEAVVEAVNRFRMQNCVIISSFDHQQLCVVRQLSGSIATGVLTSDRLAKPGQYLSMLDADAYNPGCYDEYDSMGFNSISGELDPRSNIQDTRAANFGVNVWTCNEKSQIRSLIEAGATGLITDFPNRVHEVLAEYES